jgi:tellurite resistance protein TerC
MSILWILFVALIIIFIVIDLSVFNRREHIIDIKEAFNLSLFWIVLSLLFSVFIYFAYDGNWLGIGSYNNFELDGKKAVIQYLTGYLIEKSLSLDNIFVIALIFKYFRVPGEYQHRVLFWGIIGAVVLRGIMILGGTILINQFAWMNYVFGLLLIFASIKMLMSSTHKVNPDHNPLVKTVSRIYPVTANIVGHHFIVKKENKTHVTPLLICLLVVEGSDVMFAVDSIPAVFAVTRDPFIVFTSNIFAILGLRALYFALSAILEKFHFLKYSLVFILLYVGAKMLLSSHYHISTLYSLIVIIIILIAGIIFSLYRAREAV